MKTLILALTLLGACSSPQNYGPLPDLKDTDVDVELGTPILADTGADTDTDTGTLVLGLLPTNNCGFLEGQIACNFRLLDQDGNAWELYDINNQGKVVVLEFGAVWCYWCQVASDLAEETQAKYGSDLVYMSVLTQDIDGLLVDVDEAKEWSDYFNTPTLAGGHDIIRTTLRDGYVEGLPGFYFIGRDGVIYKHLPGWNETTVDAQIAAGI